MPSLTRQSTSFTQTSRSSPMATALTPPQPLHSFVRLHRPAPGGMVRAPEAGFASMGCCAPETAAAQPSPPVETIGEEPAETRHRPPARYVWAMLPVRFCAMCPLSRPHCGIAPSRIHHRESPSTRDPQSDRRAIHAAADFPCAHFPQIGAVRYQEGRLFFLSSVPTLTAGGG